MANETGPYADGAYGHQGGAADGWPQQPQPQDYGQGQTPNPNAGGSWGQPAPAPGTSGSWGQQPPSAWPQQDRQPQAPNPWAQQQAPQGYAPQGQPQQAPQGYAPQGYAPPQYQGQQAQPPQPYQQQQPSRDGLTPNPFALPGQNAYQGYDSAPQGQPVNPYAATPLGVNTEAARDDQNFFQRTGLSKGKTVWLGVLLLAATGIWTYNKFFSTDPSTTKVGDCVHAESNAYDVKKVACTDPTANAKVVARFDGAIEASKCDPYGGDYFQQIGKDPFILCLGPVDGSAGPAPTTAG